MQINRCLLVVLDSVGIGQAHDAEKFGDLGANTLGNISDWCSNNDFNLKIPNLMSLGLGDLCELKNIEQPLTPIGSRFKAVEVSAGKDTTTGHWEMAGTPLKEAFSFFPNGYPQDIIDQWVKEANLKGVLCNKVMSGTECIDSFGAEHMQSGMPIVYTSADSVFQVAAHEDIISVERLYEICAIVRKILTPHRIGRVIARPFTGEAGSFIRTHNRKDFSLEAPKPNLIDKLNSCGFKTYSVGKISDIFNDRSIDSKQKTKSNSEGMHFISKIVDKDEKAFVFANLIDFDQLFGHRRDPKGYAECLNLFDAELGVLLKKLSKNDLIVISADHGNDPTFKGSDHTRENVPVLVYSKNKNFKASHLEDQKCFSSIAKLVTDALEIQKKEPAIEEIKDYPNIWRKMWSKDEH